MHTFFSKNKLYGNNEVEIGKRRKKNKRKKFETGKLTNRKSKIQ